MKICQKFVCFDSSVGAASSKNSSQQKSRIWKVWKNIYYLLWQLLSEKWYYKMLFSIKFWTTFYYFIFFAVIRRVIIFSIWFWNITMIKLWILWTIAQISNNYISYSIFNGVWLPKLLNAIFFLNPCETLQISFLYFDLCFKIF